MEMVNRDDEFGKTMDCHPIGLLLIYKIKKKSRMDDHPAENSHHWSYYAILGVCGLTSLWICKSLAEGETLYTLQKTLQRIMVPPIM